MFIVFKDLSSDDEIPSGSFWPSFNHSECPALSSESYQVSLKANHSMNSFNTATHPSEVYHEPSLISLSPSKEKDIFKPLKSSLSHNHIGSQGDFEAVVFGSPCKNQLDCVSCTMVGWFGEWHFPHNSSWQKKTALRFWFLFVVL